MEQTSNKAADTVQAPLARPNPPDVLPRALVESLRHAWRKVTEVEAELERSYENNGALWRSLGKAKEEEREAWRQRQMMQKELEDYTKANQPKKRKR